MARDGEVFVVGRNGQPKACLVPVSFLLPDIAPDRIAKELGKLDGKNENYKLTKTTTRNWRSVVWNRGGRERHHQHRPAPGLGARRVAAVI